MATISKQEFSGSLYDCESCEHAAELTELYALQEGFPCQPLVLPSDSDAAMKCQTLQAKLADLND